MRIALISDAWAPQVNGVVRTLTETVARVRRAGHALLTVTPDLFRSVPCPSYPEIRLALGAGARLARMLDDFAPDAVHISTEGPLGWAARRWCLDRARPFTTSFHTRFPDYVAARTGLPASLLWRPIVRFHRPAERILAATPRLADELAAHGLGQTCLWSRGVDLDLFHPGLLPHPAYATLPRPILLSVGRVAVEKNIEAFLTADVPGSKVVVGDGPQLDRLRARYPEVLFLGALHGAKLAAAYAGADAFVFPSKTDTFGLVMIEALATGTPVAGYAVPGPLDVIGADGCGVMGVMAPVGAVDDDLVTAIRRALACDRAACAAYAQHFSWDASTAQFLAALTPDLPVRIAA